MNDLNDSAETRSENALAGGRSGLRRFRSWQKWLGVLWLIVLGLSTVLLGVVIWNNREALLATLKTARYEFFLVTLVCYVMANIVMTFGWHTGLQAFGISTRLVVDLKIYFYTLAAKRVPGTIWYIVGRSVLYQRLGVSKRITSTVSGIELVVCLLTGMIVGLPALVIHLNPSPLALLVSIGGILACLVFLHPVVMSLTIGRFVPQVPWNVLRFRSMLIWSLWCGVMWILGGLMTSSIILALYDMNPSYVPLVITSWALTGAISFVAFFLPHNFGVTEITLTFLLSRFIPLPVAILVALTSRIFTTIIDIMFSSMLVFDRPFRALG